MFGLVRLTSSLAVEIGTINDAPFSDDFLSEGRPLTVRFILRSKTLIQKNIGISVEINTSKKKSSYISQMALSTL